MNKIIITKGLPCSGKSTWAKSYIKRNPNTKRVNKDLLREMVDGNLYDRKREKYILQIRDTLIDKYLKNGYDVIVDDTNLNPVHIKRIENLFSKKAEIVVNDSFLSVSLEECISRDRYRENSVGIKVILNMYHSFLCEEKLTREQKYQLWKECNESIPLREYILGLEDIFLFDIDGTVALHGNRSPYDLTKVKEDDINIHVVNLAILLSETYPIFFVSGREDICRKDTEIWLNGMGLKYEALYMRKEGDYRKDVIIKQEIFKEYFENKYNVIGVFDDRNQTVQGWRDLGLQVYQVAEGNF